jgi:hypothetical protein
MNSGRSSTEQVKSGLRLAGVIVAAIVVLCLLGLGLRTINVASWGDESRLAPGIAELLIAGAILFATVNHWAKWFFAACCGNLLRVLAMAALGRTSSVPSMTAPRAWFLTMAGLMAVMAFLTYGFAHRQPNRMDSVCLVGALVALVYSVIDATPVRWVALALSLLIVSWTCERLRDRNKPPTTTWGG